MRCESVVGSHFARLLKQPSARGAFIAALPAALAAVAVKYIDDDVGADFLSSILPKDISYQSLNFVVGIFLVFHTSHAYARLMKSAETLYTVMGDLVDMASLLFAFTRHSKAPQAEKDAFMREMARLTSLLFSVSLGELESESGGIKRAHRFSLVDMKGIGKKRLKRVMDSDHKAEVVSQMAFSLIVDNISTGVLSIPPPLLTRAFQELGDAMIKFYEVRTFKEVRFPIPFIAAAHFLLVLHWIITPLFMSAWAQGPADAGLYTFALVFSIQLLHQVALELDDPFGSDINDIDFASMQSDLNRRLVDILEEAGVENDANEGMNDGVGRVATRNMVRRFKTRTESARMGFESADAMASTAVSSYMLGGNSGLQFLDQQVSHSETSQVEASHAQPLQTVDDTSRDALSNSSSNAGNDGRPSGRHPDRQGNRTPTREGLVPDVPDAAVEELRVQVEEPSSTGCLASCAGSSVDPTVELATPEDVAKGTDSRARSLPPQQFCGSVGPGQGAGPGAVL